MECLQNFQWWNSQKYINKIRQHAHIIHQSKRNKWKCTSLLLFNAQHSFLSRAQYSSPHLNSSLILKPWSKDSVNSICIRLQFFAKNTVTILRLYLSVKSPCCSSRLTSVLNGSFFTTFINLDDWFWPCKKNYMYLSIIWLNSYKILLVHTSEVLSTTTSKSLSKRVTPLVGISTIFSFILSSCT